MDNPRESFTATTTGTDRLDVPDLHLAAAAADRHFTRPGRREAGYRHVATSAAPEYLPRALLVAYKALHTRYENRSG